MTEEKGQIFINYTFNNNYSQAQQTITPFPEEEMAKLIDFIKVEINLQLPDTLIREILDAELKYFHPEG